MTTTKTEADHLLIGTTQSDFGKFEEKITSPPVIDDKVDPEETSEPLEIETSQAGDGKPRWKCRMPYLVEPAIFLYLLAYKGGLPLKEQFMFAYSASQLLPPNAAYLAEAEMFNSACDVEVVSKNITDHCNTSLPPPVEYAIDNRDPLTLQIQADASEWLTYFNLVRNLPAIFTTLLICSYTDVAGRKLGLLLPMMGGLIKNLIYVIVLSQSWNINILFIGTFIEGLCGSQMTAQGAAYAYVADIVPKDQRSLRFNVLQALLYLATAVGNVMVGYLIQQTGFVLSFASISILYALAIVYTLFIVPESNMMSRFKEPFSVAKTFKHAITVFKIYRHKKEVKQPDGDIAIVYHGVNWIMVLLLVVFAADSMVVIGRNDVDVLYMLGLPFCWTSVVIGYYQGIKYTLKAIMDTLGVRCMLYCFSDVLVGIIGSIAGIIGNLIMAVAVNSVMLWVGKYIFSGSVGGGINGVCGGVGVVVVGGGSGGGGLDMTLLTTDSSFDMYDLTCKLKKTSRRPSPDPLCWLC